MSNPELFLKNKYVVVKNLIPLDLCRVITKYALMKEEHEFEPDLGKEAQVENAHAVYGDTLMETMLYFVRPHMESNTGLSLCPTYSYYRVYRPGMKLDPHIDRPSCEISTTVCFGFNYALQTPDYRWGMYVKNGGMTPQDPGDALIYRGQEITHWRDPFEAAEGSYQVQAFFHYIDVNGPNYPEFKYDNRSALGVRNIKTKGINN
jgi:hypothetical protein